MKTPAIVFRAQDEVTVFNLEVPHPRKHELQVRSTYSTLSAGTEGWILSNRLSWAPTRYPCVPGYQRCGVVTALGAGVTGWQVGDRVLALSGSWSNPEIAGASGAHIGLANVSTAFAYHLPAEVSDLDASSTVIAQVGYNAASRGCCEAGDWVLVLGDGLVGQCSAQAARALGAQVILIGHRPERLRIAREFSADLVIDGRTEDVSSVVRKRVGPRGVRVVIDSVQTTSSQQRYIDLVEPRRGQVVYNGFNPDDQWANVGRLQQRELTAHFVLHWTRERMEATLRLMAAGKIRISPLVTHVVPYARGPEMYRMIGARDQPFLGITLDWRDSDSNGRD